MIYNRAPYRIWVYLVVIIIMNAYLCGCHALSPIKYTKYGTESRYGAATTVTTVPLPQWVICHNTMMPRPPDQNKCSNCKRVRRHSRSHFFAPPWCAIYAYSKRIRFLPTHSIAPVILAHIFFTILHTKTHTLIWHSAFLEKTCSTRAVYIIWVVFLVVVVIYALRVL